MVCPYYISTGMFAGVQVGGETPICRCTTNKLQSKLIPILEPEFVADSVINAVLTDKEVLLLPWWSFILMAMKESVFLVQVEI